MTDFFIFAASMSLVLVAGILVPILLQLKTAARKLEMLLDNLNLNLEPLIKSFSETSTELQLLCSSINDKVEKTDEIINTVQQSGKSLITTIDTFKNNTGPLLSQICALSKGVKAFLHFFTNPDKKGQA